MKVNEVLILLGGALGGKLVEVIYSACSAVVAARREKKNRRARETCVQAAQAQAIHDLTEHVYDLRRILIERGVPRDELPPMPGVPGGSE